MSFFDSPATGLFGASTKTTSDLSGAPSAKSPSTGGLFGSATGTTQNAQPNNHPTTATTPKTGGLFGATSTNNTAPATSVIPSSMTKTFGELEKIVNNLVMDVLGQEKLFLNQTLEINSYDREIRDNQARLIAADKEVTALEEARDRLTHNMNFIDMQQKELDTVISDLEKKLGLPDWTDCGQTFPIDLTYATSADQQRTNIMKLLTSVDAQVKEADDDISEINEQLIAMDKIKENDPNEDLTVQKIHKILKKQLENIIWVDKKSEEISKKASKLAATFNNMPDA